MNGDLPFVFAVRFQNFLHVLELYGVQGEQVQDEGSQDDPEDDSQLPGDRLGARPPRADRQVRYEVDAPDDRRAQNGRHQQGRQHGIAAFKNWEKTWSFRLVWLLSQRG